MKAIEEFIEALKIGETLKERLQTVKQEQGAKWTLPDFTLYSA